MIEKSFVHEMCVLVCGVLRCALSISIGRVSYSWDICVNLAIELNDPILQRVELFLAIRGWAEHVYN